MSPVRIPTLHGPYVISGEGLGKRSSVQMKDQHTSADIDGHDGKWDSTCTGWPVGKCLSRK